MLHVCALQVLELGRPVPGSSTQSPDSSSATSGPYPVLPWLLVPNLTPDTAITDRENWVGVLQEVALPYSDPGDAEKGVGVAMDPCFGGGGGVDREAARRATLEYLAGVTTFVNDQCLGSLTAGVICHPRTMKLVRSWHVNLKSCVACMT